MKRVIIYARVSTKDQNVDMQLTDLREYAKSRKLNVVKEYIDYASGAKSDRTNYKKLFDDVRKRKCDVVLVWKFDDQSYYKIKRGPKSRLLDTFSFKNLFKSR